MWAVNTGVNRDVEWWNRPDGDRTWRKVILHAFALRCPSRAVEDPTLRLPLRSMSWHHTLVAVGIRQHIYRAALSHRLKSRISQRCVLTGPQPLQLLVCPSSTVAPLSIPPAPTSHNRPADFRGSGHTTGKSLTAQDRRRLKPQQCERVPAGQRRCHMPNRNLRDQ